MAYPEDEAILEDLKAGLKSFGKERWNLIPLLQMIQQKHAYLPNETIKVVARHLEIAPCEVYGVATLYNQFRFYPPGKHPTKVCLGTACHVRGGYIILENFERKLGIRVGETVHGHMAPSKVEGLMLGFQIEKTGMSPLDPEQTFSAIQEKARRQKAEFQDAPVPKIHIGMATCGIASRVLETKSAFEEALKERGVSALIHPIGCIGHCYAEPVQKPDGERPSTQRDEVYGEESLGHFFAHAHQNDHGEQG